MNPSYAPLLSTAALAAGQQDFPTGTLYVVATPIGNLADITLRAVHTLAICDVMACEDTRESKHLLKSYGIDKPNDAFVAVHQHNEADISALIISKLAQGARIALLCDAGTPGISDPGALLVHNVSAAGFRVVPIPGASSVTTLLSAAGLLGHQGFYFCGFLSSKGGERDKQIKALLSSPHPSIVLEAPHRIESLALSLCALDSRLITIGRELTKQFEQIVTLPAHKLPSWLAEDPNRSRGEFVLIIHSLVDYAKDASSVHADMLRILLAEVSVKGSVKLAQLLTGAPKNELYELALSLNKESDQTSQ